MFLVDGLAHVARCEPWGSNSATMYLYCRQDRHHAGVHIHGEPEEQIVVTCLFCSKVS